MIDLFIMIKYKRWKCQPRPTEICTNTTVSNWHIVIAIEQDSIRFERCTEMLRESQQNQIEQTNAIPRRFYGHLQRFGIKVDGCTDVFDELKKNSSITRNSYYIYL